MSSKEAVKDPKTIRHEVRLEKEVIRFHHNHFAQLFERETTVLVLQERCGVILAGLF